MGFKSVYRTLQELFPQVDARLLKAAAIEHSKDPNGAVEFILAEFLPYTTKPLDISSSSVASLGYPSSVENKRHFVAERVPSSCGSSSTHAPTLLPGVAANESAAMNETYIADYASLNETVRELNSTFCDTKNINELSSENTVEDANISKKIIEPNHVDLTSLHEPVHGILHSTCDYINDQLSGESVEAANSSAEMNGLFGIGPSSLLQTVHGFLGSTTCESKDIGGHLSGAIGTRELITSSEAEETSTEAAQYAYEEVYDGHHNQKSENSSLQDTAVLCEYKDLDLPDARYSSSSAVLEDAVPDGFSTNKQHISFDSHNDPFMKDLNESSLVDGKTKRSSDINTMYGSKYVELASLSIKDHTLESLDCFVQSEDQSGKSSSNGETAEFNETINGASREDVHVPDSVNINESSTVRTVVTRSGQLCRTDLLEDLIEDSKSHKRTLFSAMDSILKMMRDVELKEKVAQQAKEEAAKGGLEILARVDELKRVLDDAREANEMHFGEVYGERAILATEMMELQSRLLVLSDEKDKSLSILDTMLEALKIRLAAAEAERITAEQEKLGKEESAQKALGMQQLLMEKAVQESKILQHEAERNAKLREFLVDRGRAVDTLQGEISVICQDVKLLTEKFDSGFPLSQCLSSKQTSCILASSVSSLKSSESQQALEKSEWSSFNEFLYPSMEQATASGQVELVDEGWELFDNAS